MGLNLARYYKKHKIAIGNLLTNPILISLAVTIIIIISLPTIFNKYEIEIISRKKIDPSAEYFYADLNNDSISETIEFSQFEKNFFSLTIFKDTRVIEQWNFEGKFISTKKLAITNEHKESTKRIYFFVFKDNKIYLNCLNPFENKFITKYKFVADFIPRSKELSCGIHTCTFYDSNKDGIKEYYFFSEASFSIQPRRLFRYDPIKDTILMSDKSFAAIKNPVITDTTNNEMNLYLVSDAVGNGNINDPLSDYFVWLLCYNEDLTLKYNPIRMGDYPSNSYITSIKNDENYYICLTIYTGIEENYSKLQIYNSELELTKENKFATATDWIGAGLYSESDNNHFFIIKKNGKVEKYNTELEIVSEIELPPLLNTGFIAEDLDQDNKKELIFINEFADNLIITRSDFSDYTFKIIPNLESQKSISLMNDKFDKTKLQVVLNDGIYSLEYNLNYLFYFKYLIYVGIYAVTWFLILLIQKGQKQRAEQKYETEKRIAELQLKAIKNQIDPHFTLNIINSIGSLFYKQDREKADYVFGKYCKLLRQTVLSSDKIITTLSDELEYVENYLELEKFRNGNKFCWKTTYTENINKETKIPKMLIHTFVENAIKHGIRHLEKDGKLFISISANIKEYSISIRDNGIGRKAAEKIEVENTGRGLSILDQILELYNNLMKVRIDYSIKDIVDENKNSLGTEVLIKIPVNKN